MVICLGEPPGGFCDVGYCCCFSSLDVFTFPGYFSMPPALHPSFSGLWRPPLALSSTLATFGCFTFARFFRHSFTESATVFIGHFLPTGVFYLTLLHRQLWHVLWLRCGQEHHIQDPPLCLPSQSCPFRLAHGLQYSYCNYKIIDLSIVPVSHEV